MCKDCGCGLPGEQPVGVSAHHREHDHSHDHHRDQDHDPHHAHEHGQEHGHHHGHRQGGDRRTIEIQQSILAKNERLAERNRGFFQGRGLLALNVLSSPGSGKTTLIAETIRALSQKAKAGVIAGDLATDNDAQRLRETGAPVVQITTGTVCHLEAEMVGRALKQLDLNGLDLIIIENVGNLVCPASYDLGEELRVVLLSVTEGEDKPLKYPPIFQFADAVVVSKVDLAQACGFDRQKLLANLRRAAPRARLFELSARTGQGIAEWCDYLLQMRGGSAAKHTVA